MQAAHEDGDIAAAIAASLADNGGDSDFSFTPTNRSTAGGIGGSFNEPSTKRACEGGQAVASTSAAASGAEAQPSFVTLTDESQGVCEVAVKLPNSSRVTASFGLAQPLSDLAAWLGAQGWDMQRHRLSRAYPRQPLQEHDRSLKEAGLIGPRDMLILESAP